MQGLADKTHHFTLLDGEMIIDTLPDSHKQERRYLIYDMMAINQVSITEVSIDRISYLLESRHNSLCDNSSYSSFAFIHFVAV